MGYPDVQDGRPRYVRADGGVPGGPVSDEIPEDEATGYGLPAAPDPAAAPRGSHRAADPANGAPRPGGRTGAHRAGPDSRPGSHLPPRDLPLSGAPQAC